MIGRTRNHNLVVVGSSKIGPGYMEIAAKKTIGAIINPEMIFVGKLSGIGGHGAGCPRNAVVVGIGNPLTRCVGYVIDVPTSVASNAVVGSPELLPATLCTLPCHVSPEVNEDRSLAPYKVLALWLVLLLEATTTLLLSGCTKMEFSLCVVAPVMSVISGESFLTTENALMAEPDYRAGSVRMSGLRV